MVRDFPHGAVGRNLPADAGDTGSTSGWKGSCAAEQLSRGVTAADTRLTPMLCEEAPPRWEDHAPRRSAAVPQRPEKTRTHQRRPGATRNLLKIKTLSGSRAAGTVLAAAHSLSLGPAAPSACLTRTPELWSSPPGTALGVLSWISCSQFRPSPEIEFYSLFFVV